MKKTIMILGGAKNLGEYLSINLAKNHNVIIVDIDANYAKKIANSISEDTLHYGVDVSNEDAIKKMFLDVSKRNINIHSLIYVAGFAKGDHILDQNKKDLQLSLEVNLMGYASMAKFVAENMIEHKQGGSIININSLVGKRGSKRQSAYASAKWGALGLTRSIAHDLAPYNIRVNSLMLGHLLDSKMFESLIPGKAKALKIPEDKVKDYYIKRIPMGRSCSYEDVFNAIEFYAFEKSSFITGQAINITGGEIMW